MLDSNHKKRIIEFLNKPRTLFSQSENVDSNDPEHSVSLFARRQSEFLDGQRYDDVLVIAKVNVRKQGEGTYREILDLFEQEARGRPVVIENVVSEEHYAIYERRGYRLRNPEQRPPSFLKYTS